MIAQAVKQAQDEGWPLDQFKGIVVWVAPSASNPQDAGSGGAKFAGKWPYCVLYESSNHDFYAHEYGHALGFKHVWGPAGPGQPPLIYQDPYCVMAAQWYMNNIASFATPADVDGPPAGDQFWRRLAPMPAAATLYIEVPDFAASHHVFQIGTIAAGWQRSVTLRARDLTQGNFPVLAVAQAGPGVTGGRLAYTIELRRSKDWDKGIEPGMTPGASPPAGLVIHSLQNLDEDPGAVSDLETNPKVYYEGNLPLPSPTGDADWHSTSGDFVVRVDKISDDLSWVDLTVGGANLLNVGAVTVDIAVGGSSELVEEGDEQDVLVFICHTGDYHFYIDHQTTQLTCTATAFGYDNPQFRWRVNGVVLTSIQKVKVPAVSTFPRPKTTQQEARNVSLSWSATANRLVLTADPADGNYMVEIEATATEGNPLATPTLPNSGKAVQRVDTILISWEQRYYDDVAACIKHLRDLNERFAKSRGVLWPTLNPGDPIARVRVVLNMMQRDLAAENPILAEHLNYTASLYARMGLQAPTRMSPTSMKGSGA